MIGSDATVGAPRAKKLAKAAAIGTLAVATLLIVPPWIQRWWMDLRATTRHDLAVGFLVAVLVAYGVALVGSIFVGSITLTRLVVGRRRRRARPWSARGFALCLATLLGLAMLEVGAWGFAAWNRLPPAPPKPPPAKPVVPSAKSGPDALTLLVLGESSAQGQPFDPYVSIGQIVAWEVERAQPGRKVEVLMAASGGQPLKRAVELLDAQDRRPDLVVLCSGHNEFQARFGWSRVINYYDDDFVERPRAPLVDRVGEWTSFTRMIRDAVALQEIDQPPPPRVVRSVVERPSCPDEDRAQILERFAADLELILDWCRACGATPILVIPAGNDAGYDPDRSILARTTRSADREAFAGRFLATKEAEPRDPDAAIAAYRAMIAEQPGFAETHYRLALLLHAKGLRDEAREHFTLARDLDAVPMRCPSEFQDVYRRAAAAHPEVVLVDGPRLLVDVSPEKQLDDHLFHDAQHPSFRAYLALAQDAIDQLRGRQLFGLARMAAEPIDPDSCARHFGLDAAEPWVAACRRASYFWTRLSIARYAPRERERRARVLLEAAKAIEAGADPEHVGVPGLGVNPNGFPKGGGGRE